jgi:hypothetical protein
MGEQVRNLYTIKRRPMMNQIINSMKLLLFVFLVVTLISCDDKATESNLGNVEVKVIDNDVASTPVPNVEITLLPLNKIAITDSNGVCNFAVRPGNYLVSGEVCCAGPGLIEYQVRVNVNETRTSIVTLMACLSCE